MSELKTSVLIVWENMLYSGEIYATGAGTAGTDKSHLCNVWTMKGISISIWIRAPAALFQGPEDGHFRLIFSSSWIYITGQLVYFGL